MAKDKKTKTQIRIEFLRRCLEKGMSRVESAEALCAKDSRVSRAYAITLVYSFFSGDDYVVKNKHTVPINKTPAKKKVTPKKKKSMVSKTKSKPKQKSSVKGKSKRKSDMLTKAEEEIKQKYTVKPRRTKRSIVVEDDDLLL